MKDKLKSLDLIEGLSDETKLAIVGEIESLITESQTQLHAQYTQEVQDNIVTLSESIDTQVRALVETEMAEMREDLKNYRNLEVEYAAKLVQESATLQAKYADELQHLTENLQEYLTVKMTQEVTELRESIAVASRNKRAVELYEAFAEQFRQDALEELGLNSINEELSLSKNELKKIKKELVESRKDAVSVRKNIKINQLTESLNDSAKKVMSNILKTVEYNELDKEYEKHISSVLESVTVSNSKTNTQPLNENVTDTITENTISITGNRDTTPPSSLSNLTENERQHIEYVKRMAIY